MADHMAPGDVPLLGLLGAKISTLTYSDLTEHGLQVFRTALVDTLGVALAGAEFEGARMVRAVTVPDSPGQSLILGTGDRVGALDAGMLNGIAGHALDYDDGNRLMGGHPSTLLIPAVLALGEDLGASAHKVIAAYAAGYEVMIRLSRGVNTAHYQKGWHPTATIGVLGVAAAGARLLDLDAERTTTAIALAASMASGIKANFGTMVKSLHVGHAVRDGLMAAELAPRGFTANPFALEHDQGFLTVYNGVGQFDAKAIVAGLDGDLEINTASNPIKAFPCCASTHAAIKSAIDIRAEHDLRDADVDTVHIVVDANRMPHTDRPVLQEALSGKFSLQYVVARALTEGKVVLEHFGGNAHRDRAVVDLMGRVSVSAAPPGGTPNSFGAVVTVTTKNGDTFVARADRPATDDEGIVGDPPNLWEKFVDCAGRVLDPAEVAALRKGLERFPDFADVRDFTRLAEPVSRESGAPVGALTV